MQSISGEERILSILNGIRHPNILELLGSYTLRDEVSLIFPLASQSLKAVFSSDERPPGFETDFNIITALPGLASALQALHFYVNDGVSFIGCHHDLKPDNVLLMDGKFILSDFGLSTFKDHAATSDSYFRVGQSYYFAPECEDCENDFQLNHIARSSDIWSLGCIFLEMLVYMARGAAGVANFTKDRKVTFGGYFVTSTFHHGKLPNAAVQDSILQMRQTVSDDGLFLLVELADNMLSIRPQERPNAQSTLETIRQVAVKHTANIIQSLFENLTRSATDVDLTIEKEAFTS